MSNMSVPKWLYRLESEDPNNGLWYNSNGDFVWGISVVEDCVEGSKFDEIHN